MPPARTHEYFVPRDGIDREVISADICRYLGNDALVRPGNYENPQTGQTVNGYYITAYRNLTTAMIDDLKADSARWENERRAQTSRNAPGVQYRQSETHQSRQHQGPSDGPYIPESYGRDPAYDGPRYPGTGAPGYTGATGAYPPQPAYPQGAQYMYAQSQQSPPPQSGYAPNPQAGLPMNQGYPTGQESPYIATGANHNRYETYGRGGVASAAPPQQPVYATSAQTQQGYPTSYQYANQVPTPASMQQQQQHAEGYYGRASPAGQNPTAQPSGYPAQNPPQQQQQQQYDANPLSPASASVPPPAKAQAIPSGSSNRRSDPQPDRTSTTHHRSSRR